MLIHTNTCITFSLIHNLQQLIEAFDLELNESLELVSEHHDPTEKV